LIGTFCTVGNLKRPFNRFFEIIFDSISILPKPILIQSGYNQINYSDLYKFKDFFEITDHQKFIETSKVVISHAGAGTIFQCLNLKKIPIVIPRLKKFNEHVNDHQLDLSVKLRDLNLIYVAEDNLTTKKLIKQNIFSRKNEIEFDPLIYKLKEELNMIINK
jgi:UDP-N-acetylglucosamine transferase subunit ALG13